MTKQLLITACASVLLAACSGSSTDGQTDTKIAEAVKDVVIPSGVTLVETVGKTGDEIVIPYKKYVLDNGLTVVLHQDKSDPLAHVDVTFHVGSAREDIGKSGFAHFFEHMLFQGSANVADDQHFKIVSESGGTLNGSTNTDRTNYYETVPSNQLEKMLWLEADRMGYFLDAVTPESFENQRETVKNERGQNYDNRPYGLLRERVGEAMFPEGHPYSWLTIGYIEDLNRASLDDLKKFFLRWYGPNNAVITIGGDFDETQTLEWVKKYFGPIPKGPDVEEPVYTPVTLDEDRYISMEDNVSLPLIYMSWPTVHANHPDEAPLDVLMSILGEGKTSLLYKNLEKPGLTVNSSAGHGCGELSCQFTLFALPNPAKGTSLAEIETLLRGSLEEFEERGVLDDDLTRVKSGIVSGMIYGLESVSGKIRQLAAYETYRNTPNGIGADIARYENVTKADVVRVYNQYIKNKPAVIMSIVPKGKLDMIVKPDTWERYERVIPASEPVTVDWTAPVDDFDRSIMPPSGPNPSVKVPPVYNAKLSNGIEILAATSSETPTSTISIRINAGQSQEPIEKLGLASITAAMLGEATTDSSVEDLSNRLDKLGSSVSIGSGDEFTTIYIRSLTKNLDETVEIAAEKFFSPKFDPADFARVKAQYIEGIKSSKKDASTVATEIFNRKLFGDNNSFAWGNSGTTESIENLTIEDVKVFYAENYSPEITTVVAVSDLGKGKLVSALKPFSGWEGGAVERMPVNSFPELETGTLYFVHKEDAAQSQIRIGNRSMPFDATGEYYRAGLMNYSLGGAFNSRINMNLREDKGYSYGARSFFSGNDSRGYYRAGAGVRSDSTQDSIVQFVTEITEFRNGGITADELTFTKNAIGQRDALSYESPRQKLGFLSNMVTYDLDPSFVDEQNAILQAMTKGEMDALADKHLNLDDMIMVVVGDRDVVFEGLETLGYPIVELDEDGNRQ